MQQSETKEQKPGPTELLLSTVREAVSKFLIAIWIAVIALLLFLARTFLSRLWQDYLTQPISMWKVEEMVATLVLLTGWSAVFLYLGRKWERRRPKVKFKMIPFEGLLWKGFLKAGFVHATPHCPTHSIPLYMKGDKYCCPKCGGDKFDSLNAITVMQLNQGAQSLLQGILDKKVKI